MHPADTTPMGASGQNQNKFGRDGNAVNRSLLFCHLRKPLCLHVHNTHLHRQWWMGKWFVPRIYHALQADAALRISPAMCIHMSFHPCNVHSSAHKCAWKFARQSVIVFANIVSQESIVCEVRLPHTDTDTTQCAR